LSKLASLPIPGHLVQSAEVFPLHSTHFLSQAVAGPSGELSVNPGWGTHYPFYIILFFGHSFPEQSVDNGPVQVTQE